MFRRLLLAAAFLAAIHPYAKADYLNITVSPYLLVPGDSPSWPSYHTESFNVYTYDFAPYNANYGGNPDPTTYFTPAGHYDSRFILGDLPVTRTYVDAQGVTHTTTATETVTMGYSSGYQDAGADPGEYILGMGGKFQYHPFYSGTVFPGTSAAVLTFSPGTFTNDSLDTQVTITDLTTAATPEPSSMVLAGSGLLSGLGMVFRRRRTVA